MDFLESLNPQQREAVCHVQGPLLVLAGAGSGKTRVITHRIAHLIRTHGVSGWSILAVTFTNKAADEMRQRVAGLLGGAGPQELPLLSTFHSFCVRLLRRDGSSLADLRPGFTRDFQIYDEDDQAALVKRAYRDLGLDDKFLPYRAALSRISRAKNHKETPEAFRRKADDPHSLRLARVYQQYEEFLLQANALDFDDLLLEAVRLLEYDEPLRERTNRRFRFLLIDEYQDTNRSQYELMRLLTREHQNVCVVGDEDQSIYGWRGADIRNILDFEKDYPTARVIRLEQNYRSTRSILDTAGALVAHNRERKGKTLWTESGAGEPVGLYRAMDSENEALFIADSILKLLHQDGRTRVAVLYRTNAQSRQIEEALRRYQLKYIVVGGFSFYQRAEIKDVLAYLKLLVTPQDSVSLLRILNVPARGIGKTTVEHLERCARERRLGIWDALGALLKEGELPARADAALRGFREMMEDLQAEAASLPPHQALTRILAQTGYSKSLQDDHSPEADSRRENLDELLNAAREASERGEGIQEFLDHAALVADSDALDEKAQISLLTMHNAKGLEFPVVFIAGLEEGLLPHARSTESPQMIEEERRLCYVGMTRAEQRLFLSWAEQRRRFGGGSLEPSQPSRFLKEIPRAHIQDLNRARYGRQVDLYAERHEVRETVKRNLYTGKTYNSVENIAQFFGERGLPVKAGLESRQAPVAGPRTVQPAAAPKPAAGKKKKGVRAGVTVRHPRYGTGLVLRQEGDGDEAKLTVSFPSCGLKKLLAKYAELQIEE